MFKRFMHSIGAPWKKQGNEKERPVNPERENRIRELMTDVRRLNQALSPWKSAPEGAKALLLRNAITIIGNDPVIGAMVRNEQESDRLMDSAHEISIVGNLRHLLAELTDLAGEFPTGSAAWLDNHRSLAGMFDYFMLMLKNVELQNDPRSYGSMLPYVEVFTVFQTISQQTKLNA